MMTLNELKAKMEALGEKVSPASWEDELHIYVFSVRGLGPATFGHPAVTLHVFKPTGNLQVTGDVFLPVDFFKTEPEPEPEVDSEGHTLQLSTGKTVTGVYWQDGENGLEEFGCNEWDSLTEADRDALFSEVERLADEACREFFGGYPGEAAGHIG